ncbi:HD domain-containing phosphohydrolase [Bacteroides sp.]|uniref:HD-GYP domain-containing protein n=1 Tax=Bacteroides sp. TaxID=29523 RepID=UPI00260C7AF9|nr:HD domain-containing phosphohydrolase [Bacteroides sp.]MDD3040395.1 HD domain-containing protein [Bacteroides sp.]
MNKIVFLYFNQLQKYDIETFRHSYRVSIISCLIGQQLGLSINELNTLKDAAYLHDLGKLKVPQKILNKPGDLSSEEWAHIKDHPRNGYRLLKRAKYPTEQISNAILAHHEHYDGRGYPNRIGGEDIPYLARIITVADGLDAMVNVRPYRNPTPVPDAYKEIKECAGSQFDPYVTNALSKVNSNELSRGIYKEQQLKNKLLFNMYFLTP